jgi:hypothetical protein
MCMIIKCVFDVSEISSVISNGWGAIEVSNQCKNGLVKQARMSGSFEKTHVVRMFYVKAQVPKKGQFFGASKLHLKAQRLGCSTVPENIESQS